MARSPTLVEVGAGRGRWRKVGGFPEGFQDVVRTDDLGQQIVERHLPSAELAEAEEAYAEQVSEAVSSDEETAAYVAELEKRTDELDLEEHEDLPSGDTLAAELTRFLRERDAESGDDPPREQ